MNRVFCVIISGVKLARQWDAVCSTLLQTTLQRDGLNPLKNLRGLKKESLTQLFAVCWQRSADNFLTQG